MNGGTSPGSLVIYNKPDAVTREINYLFDGIIQPIVHERLHNYIANYFAINSFCNYIRNNDEYLKDSSTDNVLTRTYKYCEEPIITNTTYQILKNKAE
jgi:hypothetical protein